MSPTAIPFEADEVIRGQLGGALLETIDQQAEHLSWHGESLHHWHVGATALDVDGHRTEDVRRLLGWPVFRDCNLPRNTVRAVPSERSSCHWPSR